MRPGIFLTLTSGIMLANGITPPELRIPSRPDKVPDAEVESKAQAKREARRQKRLRSKHD